MYGVGFGSYGSSLGGPPNPVIVAIKDSTRIPVYSFYATIRELRVLLRSRVQGYLGPVLNSPLPVQGKFAESQIRGATVCDRRVVN